MRVALAPALALVVAVMLVPLAAAEMRFDEPSLEGSPVAPLSGVATFTANVAVDCQHVPPSGAAILRITATPEHAGVRANAPPDHAVDSATCLGQSAVAVPIQAQFMVDANVPGET